MLLQICVCALGEEKEILVEHDDGIRPDISAGALGKLKAVFKKDGTTTAGNSSQVQLLTSVLACLQQLLQGTGSLECVLHWSSIF